MIRAFSLSFFGLLLNFFLTSTTLAETPAFEVMCRQKAKEVAAESYRGCITENRKVQIEQLKNDYQQRLKSLKEEYEGEIKKMSGGGSVTPALISPANVAPQAQITAPVPAKKARRASRSTTKTLPMKTTNVEEMTLRLRSTSHDDSTMDIPEPIPVESTPAESESY